MEAEFLTADTALPPCLPLPWAMLGLPVKQHRQGHVCPPAGRRSCGGGGGRQRDHICPLSHRRAGGGAGAQRHDSEAGLAGIGGRRTAPAGASGLRGAEKDLCPHSKGCTKTGLREGHRAGIMKESNLPCPPSLHRAERREAARKFAREHNTAERLYKK